MANQHTIQELVTFARGNDESLKSEEFEFGKFGHADAQQISQATGVNIIGATRLIKPYGIDHVIAAHGSITEINRGQRPITDADFDLVPLIVHDYDSYIRASDDKRGNPGIYFNKVITGMEYTVCMTCTHKNDRNSPGGVKRKMTLSTMFKKTVP